jgi:hypothetical protein
MKKLLSSTIVSIALIATTQAKADPAADLKACLDQVEQAEAVIDACGLAIEKERDYGWAMEQQNIRLQESLRLTEQELQSRAAWYRDAAIMAPIALALGIIIGATAVGSSK